MRNGAQSVIQNAGPRERSQSLAELADRIVEGYGATGRTSHLGCAPLPSYATVVQILADLNEILFPGYGRRQALHQGNIAYHVGTLLYEIRDRLADQIARALWFGDETDCIDNVRRERGLALAEEFLHHIPDLREMLVGDVQAAYDGDPAAKGLDEIIFCYPGLRAIAIHRVAHQLHRLGVPLIPRMMTEYAHGKTGIDIHPGATIGRSFFIDHGTGVVIGETTVIGDRVKLYQGVTLGALSFPRDETTGELRRDTKRHPTLEDGVVIYANATVLGGKTVIGHHSVIGSSAWLTQSVAPYTTVLIESPRLRYRGAPGPNGDSLILDYQI